LKENIREFPEQGQHPCERAHGGDNKSAACVVFRAFLEVDESYSVKRRDAAMN